jgi:hypothetical protein
MPPNLSPIGNDWVGDQSGPRLGDLTPGRDPQRIQRRPCWCFVKSLRAAFRHLAVPQLSNGVLVGVTGLAPQLPECDNRLVSGDTARSCHPRTNDGN